MIEGVDVSVYQGAISLRQWKALYDAGQRVAVVGSAHPIPNRYAEDNLSRASAAGLILATYMALHPALTGAEVIERGKTACGAMWKKLAFVAVDCELDGLTEQQIADALLRVYRLGQRRCIYTARWWWRDHFGDSQRFKAEPLWNAYYDSDPDIDFPSAPYGGWTLDKVIGEQYAGTVQLAGVTVDRNSFREDFVMPTPTQGQLLLAAGICAQAAVEFAKGNYYLTPDLKAKLKFLAQ